VGKGMCVRSAMLIGRPRDALAFPCTHALSGQKRRCLSQRGPPRLGGARRARVASTPARPTCPTPARQTHHRSRGPMRSRPLAPCPRCPNRCRRPHHRRRHRHHPRRNWHIRQNVCSCNPHALTGSRNHAQVCKCSLCWIGRCPLGLLARLWWLLCCASQRWCDGTIYFHIAYVSFLPVHLALPFRAVCRPPATPPRRICRAPH